MKISISILLVALITISSCREAEKRPNIIYIMSDDHAFQAISAYGSALSRLAPTPNIDRIAAEGMLFRQAFVENSLCTPSRACLMTGLYSHQNGQRQLLEGIDTTKVFVSELLRKAGYQTSVVGKWHMRCEPKGFDYYKILNGQGRYYNPDFKTNSSNGKYLREEGYATTLITDNAIQFMKDRDRERPFCLFVHHKAPHRNWMPEPRYAALFEETDFPLPETFADDYQTRCSAAMTQTLSIRNDMELISDLKLGELKDIPPYNKEPYAGLGEELERMTPAQRKSWDSAYVPANRKFLDAIPQGEELLRWKYQRYIKDYLRSIRSIDDGIGRLLDYLDKNGLTENTIIIYTSDQGFYTGEHGWFDKRFMYEESFRTPLLIRYPRRIRAGTKSDALVQNIDYAPTLLSLAGVEKPMEMSGTSLEPLFSGEKPATWRTSLYYHYYDYPAFHNVRRHDGVRTERHKLIHFYGKGGLEGATNPLQKDPSTAEYRMLQEFAASGEIGNDVEINCDELYDLSADPHELNNLIGKPGQESITRQLQELLDRYRKDLKVPEF